MRRGFGTIESDLRMFNAKAQRRGAGVQPRMNTMARMNARSGGSGTATCRPSPVFPAGYVRLVADDSTQVVDFQDKTKKLTTRNIKNTKMHTRLKLVEKQSSRPLSFACVRFRPNEHPLSSGSNRSFSFAYVRIRSHTSAFVRLRSLKIFLFTDEAESGRTRQLLPGGGELRRAPECVTANSSEYAALAGLFHRDSPEYVTKKICAQL